MILSSICTDGLDVLNPTGLKDNMDLKASKEKRVEGVFNSR